MPNLEHELRFAASYPNGSRRTSELRRIAGKLDGLDEITVSAREPDLDEVFGHALFFYIERVASNEESWTEALIDWLAAATLPWVRNLRILSDLAWAMRKEGVGPLTELRISSLVERDADDIHTALKFILFLQAARFDFNFKVIDQAINALPSSARACNPEYFNAIDLLASYGSGGRSRTGEAREIVQSTGDVKILQVVAHALWFSSDDEDAIALIEITEMMLVQNSADSVARFRQATAHRRLGNFEQGLKVVDDGIALCEPHRIEDIDMLIEERDRITLQRDVSARITRASDLALAEMREAFDTETETLRAGTSAEVAEVRQATSEATFKVVEILGIFSAIIALLATSIAGSIGGELLWWQRVAIVLSGALGSLGFFVVLRFIVKPGRSRNVVA